MGPEHGPLYYAMMRATTRPEPNEVLTRLPFALAGLAGIVAAFAAGRAVSGPWLGIGAAGAVAASPIHVYYSREARPYALLFLCGVAGLYALVQAMRTGRSLPWLSLLAAAAVAALFVSANGASVAAALLAGAIWAWPLTWRQAPSWLGLLALAGGACWVVPTRCTRRP
ncbi:MAG: glycosyltransferase family 39 protein [Vicinamibacteraceae bacterium]